jgi:NAD(P)-dependent dehydrogenase (short-subunit alcohol dehydrogenase family)
MKTILITGGNRGLGKALVDHFYKRNWKVLAMARDVNNLPTSQGTEKTGFVLSLSMHPLHVWTHIGQQHGQLQQPYANVDFSEG